MSEEQGHKRFYGVEAARRLGERIATVYPRFDVEAYVATIAQGVAGLELKARVMLLMEELRARLPQAYPEAVAIVVASLGPELTADEGIFNDGWFWSPAVALVQTHGLAEPEISLAALNAITRRYTAEEAIRPYIVQHYDLTMARLGEWVTDESFHVRRLVSEGTRPRLPWAMRLERFVREPRPTLALLEKLRDDPAVYVQKSVANHLNDIAKDHPALVLDTAERWLADSPTPTRRWVVRHGLRTLIKAGNPRALALLGAEPPLGIELAAFSVTPPRVTVGESVTMRLEVMNTSDVAQTLVIDYAVHFVMARGNTSPKVFKWKRLPIAPGGHITLQKRHFFRPISTRRYYAGVHRLAVQVNGVVLGAATVELVNS